MELSRKETLDIFMNPKDLRCIIFTSEMNGKHKFMVTRGPKGCFAPLLTTGFVFKTAEEAIGNIKLVFEEIVETSTAELENPGAFTRKIIDHELPFKKGRDVGFLTHDIAAKIIVDLRDKGVAETF